MWHYSDKVKEHFFKPRNVGTIEDPDGVGEVGSLACGDALKLTFRLDEQGRIAECKFQTFGCGSAIASSSVLTEMVIGKTVKEAEQITNQDIVDVLGGLPEEKMHCSVMGREALEAAIASYRGEKPAVQEDEIVCKCFGVTDREIERVARENNLATVDEITHYTKAGGGCGQCKHQIEEILAKIRAQPEEAGAKALTNVQKIRLIEETLDREIRPALQADGGDIELIDLIGNRVVVAMRGMCTNCPSSPITVEQFVGSKLREMVAADLTVEVAEE